MLYHRPYSLYLYHPSIHHTNKDTTFYVIQISPNYSPALQTASKFRKLIKEMEKACKRAVVPPTSLRELSQRTFQDLQGVFRSNVAVCRLACELEQVICQEIAREVSSTRLGVMRGGSLLSTICVLFHAEWCIR